MLSALRARLVASALVSAGVMFFLVCQSRPLAIAMLAAPVAGWIVGPSVEAKRSNQLVVAFAALAAGVLAPRFAAVEHPLGGYLGDRTLLAACPALLVATSRTFFRAPAYGAPLTVAIGLVALAACGRAISPAYPVAIAAYVLLGLAGVATSDEGRAWPADASRAHASKIAFASVVALVTAVAFALGLPRLHEAIVAKIAEQTDVRTGFSTGLSLSDLDGMLQSDEVVARVRRGSPKLLRGAVFSRYAAGFWSDPTNNANRVTETTSTTPPVAGPSVEIEYPKRPDRYFLPVDATDVRASTGIFSTNIDGIRAPLDASYAKRLWYVPGKRPPGRPPLPEETTVPTKLRRVLTPLAEAWAEGATPLARMRAIEIHLQQNDAYSLSFQRSPELEPVEDFLFVHREGHCEYFASALALLGRSIGVPTRVITGFRVVESSPLGGYRIVRERNAHAWVEAFIDGEWVTFDPTPASDVAATASPRRTPLLAALADLVSTSWEKVDDFLAARSPFELSLALVGLLGLLLLVRRLRDRGPARAAASIAAPSLPCFDALEARLRARGIARAPAETLAAFARRLEGAERADEGLGRAAAAVRAYAELRYGGRDDEGAVIRAVESATAALAEPRRAA